MRCGVGSERAPPGPEKRLFIMNGQAKPKDNNDVLHHTWECTRILLGPHASLRPLSLFFLPATLCLSLSVLLLLVVSPKSVYRVCNTFLGNTFLRTLSPPKKVLLFPKKVLQNSVYRLGHAIDKKLLSTINKILIDKLSIRSFCY